MNNNMRKCRMCKKQLVGRSDKMFCKIYCKNEYHFKLRAATTKASKNIDFILHRNRSILLELTGKNTFQKKIPRLILEKKNFKFNSFLFRYNYLQRSNQLAAHILSVSITTEFIKKANPKR